MKIKPLEEYHLMKLLKDFDTVLALSYLAKVKSATQLIEDKGLSGALDPIEDGVLVDPIGFRISLREPAFIMLSHPICRLRAKVPYPKQIEWERYFVAHLAMVPIYLVNLNVITVLKLWGEDSSSVVSKPFQDELDKGDLLLELLPSSQPAQYSSMNFVLQYGATKYKAADELLEPIRKYYRYGFWASPGKGYTFSSHFLHRRSKVTCFMKVTKSLYIVNSVGNNKRIYIEGCSVDCKKLDLIGFTFRDGEIHVVSGIEAFAPVEAIEDLEQKKDIRKCFLNAMMIELRSEHGKLNLLSDIVDIGESSFDLIMTLLGLQISQLYSDSDRPCHVCGVDDLRKSTVSLFKEISKHIDLPVTISDSTDSFGLAFCSLYPFLVVSGKHIMFTHPMVIGFLAQQGKLNLLDFNNCQLLLDLLDLLEKIHATKRQMDIYLDSRMDMFRGISKRDSMNQLYSIERRIQLYKCLYRSFSCL
ncbi:MAG: hypothetical protein H3Z51_14270 [archaeon]|nr:hypothetical protein [archaeon]